MSALGKIIAGIFGLLFLGLMIFVVVPKALDLIYRHNEGATIGGLNAIRSALRIYKDDEAEDEKAGKAKTEADHKAKNKR